MVVGFCGGKSGGIDYIYSRKGKSVGSLILNLQLTERTEVSFYFTTTEILTHKAEVSLRVSEVF